MNRVSLEKDRKKEKKKANSRVFPFKVMDTSRLERVGISPFPPPSSQYRGDGNNSMGQDLAPEGKVYVYSNHMLIAGESQSSAMRDLY